MDAFPTNIVAKEQDGKNAIWKETCKIICTQKSSVTWRTENTWEHNDILAGLGEKLENFSPPTFFSLEKSCFPTTFPRQTISLKNVGAGLQKWKMPPDAKMPLVPIKMPPVVPTIWLDDQPWNLGCHELQHALLLFRKSSVPDESLARVCVISLNFRMDAHVQHEAGWQCLLPMQGKCTWLLTFSICSSPEECEMCFAKATTQTGIANKCNFTQFHHRFAQPPPLSGQADPRYQKRSVIMNASCFIPVPYKGPDGASNREKHRSWYFFRCVNQHSGKYLCSILKIQADVYQTRPKNSPLLCWEKAKHLELGCPLVCFT